MRSGELTDRCVEAMNDARSRVLVHSVVSMTMANYHMVEAVMRVCLDAAAEVCEKFIDAAPDYSNDHHYEAVQREIRALKPHDSERGGDG
jgi:hypothetical protein